MQSSNLIYVIYTPKSIRMRLNISVSKNQENCHMFTYLDWTNYENHTLTTVIKKWFIKIPKNISQSLKVLQSISRLFIENYQ